MMSLLCKTACFAADATGFNVPAVTALDQQASEKLARMWTESQPVVAAYVLSIIPNFHQAEDVLQQVAVALVGEFERFDSSKPFLPWALGIARNMALKSRRTAVRRWKHELNEALIERIESAFQEQDDVLVSMRQWLRHCLRKQPQKVLELLQWRYAHDLKPSEVAPKMGITSGAVRAMLHRSREALRKCIRRSAQGAVEWS